MHSSSSTVDLLSDFSRILGQLSMRWYLFGAQAAAIYGSPRVTADVDVTVELSDVTIETFVATLQSAGFVPRVPDPVDLAKQMHVLPMVHSKTSMPIDVVFAGSGLETEFLDRARLVNLEGVSVPVITGEDLIVAKILAGRRHDLTDVRAVLDAQPNLSLERVRSVLSRLEQLLGQSDLLPVLERLLDNTWAI